MSVSPFDWRAGGPSVASTDAKFNGINTRKSLVAREAKDRLPVFNYGHKLEHARKSDVPMNQSGGENNEQANDDQGQQA
jgi:hypothetical protein